MSEAQRSCQGPEGHWNWVWQVVSIVAQETGSNSRQIQVWQFADYAPMNGERIHAGKAGARPAVAGFNTLQRGGRCRRVRCHLFGAPGYGARVTVENFDELVARREDERRQFLADNPWVPQELDEMIRRARSLDGAATSMRKAP